MILELYSQLSEAIKSNPFLAGAVGLYGVGIVTWVCRSVPTRIWNFISHQTTTTVTFNNGEWANREMFLTFLQWHQGNKLAKYSRNLSFEAKYNDDGDTRLILGPGYGRHFFVFEGRLYWFNKQEKQGSISDRVKETVSISTFGRNHENISCLIDHFTPKRNVDTEIGLFNFATLAMEWNEVGKINKRPLESLALADEVIDPLIQSLDDFYKKRDWFLNTGVAHKFTVILHGIPGAGKTSLVKALASKYDASIYTVNLVQLSDITIESAVRGVKSGSFLLLEDFDSSMAVMARELVSIEGQPQNKLSLSSVLNALDGVANLDNVVIFLTTNHLERIDAAVTRKGRTDMLVELGKLRNAEIRKYIKHVYGDIEVPDVEFKPIVGCDLQSFLLSNKEDSAGFINDLVEWNSNAH